MPAVVEAESTLTDHSQDIHQQHLERLQALDQSIFERVTALVGEMTVDLDTPLSAEDE